MSPAASTDVKELDNAGLMKRTVVGRRHVRRRWPGPVASAVERPRFCGRSRDDRMHVLRQALDRPPTHRGGVMTAQFATCPAVRRERTSAAPPHTVHRDRFDRRTVVVTR
jgi:hypothetical protein